MVCIPDTHKPAFDEKKMSNTLEPNYEEGIVFDNNQKMEKKTSEEKGEGLQKSIGNAYHAIVEKVKEKVEQVNEQVFNGEKILGESQEPKPGVIQEFSLRHPLWTDWEVNEALETQRHKYAKEWSDKLAYSMIKMLKLNFNLFSGFYFGKRNPGKWLTHILLLETIAGVPGTVGSLIRHLTSIGVLRKDHGWIHSMIEEAENERVHLLTALELKKPTRWLRVGVMTGQFAFFAIYLSYYLISPKFSHRFVGYLEEEAIRSYTRCLKDMEQIEEMKEWGKSPAPEIAKKYWHLNENATVRDVILMIRADEAHHRDVNHTMSDLKSENIKPVGAPA